jgi:uncharacterized protein
MDKRGAQIQRKLKTIFSIVALTTAALPAQSAGENDLFKARNAIKMGCFQQAFRTLTLLSNKGMPKAQCELAYLYEHGLGTPVDHEKALNLYLQAAMSGPEQHGRGKKADQLSLRQKLARRELSESSDIFDRLQLARCYQLGIDGEEDFQKAASIYQQLSQLGLTVAMNNLAFLYEQGKGVPQDCLKAAELYSKAAAAGLPEAENNLGCLFYEGRGVPRDPVRAVALFKKAAGARDAAALCNLGWMRLQGEGVQQDYSKALALFAQSASCGVAAARFNLGYMLEYGTGVKRNTDESNKLYEMAASEMLSKDCRDGVRGSENVLSFTCKQTLKSTYRQSDSVASNQGPN